ncbi:N-formylglutamate deformylase [Comamonas sp. BIGb0152]|uniref:N-formylglutamate deformylase n=1 Tax=Comamonas sp. BIGb0152 TaxID=2940601 RepID=UPI0021682C10|nr:N-formylglutamate deformylase [Comamonas sp. BIGb0152]MCS4294659.1 N-formylglutamate deformylase [Comamonas sp. BIGb0152]
MHFETDRAAFEFRQGTAPLLISFPHVGTYVPPALAERFTPEAREVHDTDWHLPLLYAFAQEIGASTLVATHSRLVVDMNRSPDGASLYPGQSVTGLCPVDTFADTPVYQSADLQPDDAEIAQRREQVWQPYHDQLAAELARIKAAHGAAGLWDAHSIQSVLPRFFEGKLPDLNLGTNQGASCGAGLGEALLDQARKGEADGFSSVLNGRFQGGYITRHYGQPAQNVHAIQLEMTQSSYMQEHMPFDYLPDVAAKVQPHVRRMVERLLAYVQQSAR